MKRAFLILGAEGSGGMVVTRALCSSGVFGDWGHHQRLDEMDFINAPEDIVIRRSFPYGEGWPDAAELVRNLEGAAYQVEPVLVIRNLIANIESQARNGHAATHRIAHDSINHAIELAYRQMAEVGLYPHVIAFEAFIRSAAVRKAFFNRFSLPEPSMDFHDSTAKYRTPQDPAVLSH